MLGRLIEQSAEYQAEKERIREETIRAGYKEKTAAEQGARLLINVKVKIAIDKAIEERAARTEVTQDDVAEYALYTTRQMGIISSGIPSF